MTTKWLAEIALFTPDVEAAMRFYRRLLGDDPVSAQAGETATFVVNGVKLFLLHHRGRVPRLLLGPLGLPA